MPIKLNYNNYKTITISSYDRGNVHKLDINSYDSKNLDEIININSLDFFDHLNFKTYAKYNVNEITTLRKYLDYLNEIVHQTKPFIVGASDFREMYVILIEHFESNCDPFYNNDHFKCINI